MEQIACRRFKNAGLLGVLITVIALLPACSITTKLTNPLPIKEFGVANNEVIGLYVPEASRNYVWKGNINITPYSVEFGNALEPNVKYALSKIFREVVLVDVFPVPALSTKDVMRSVSVEIETAKVSPGALTFSSTSAELRLKAIFSKAGQIEGDPILVLGRATASAGGAGYIPLLNQVAYNAALQKAAEQAMTDALEQLVDEIIKRRGGGR